MNKLTKCSFFLLIFNGVFPSLKADEQPQYKIRIIPELAIAKENLPEDIRYIRFCDTETDPEGNIYILDDIQCRVYKFSSKGKYLLYFGKSGTGKGKFIFPTHLIYSPSGRICVLDGALHRVNQFDCSGKYLTSFTVDMQNWGNDLDGCVLENDQLLLRGYRDGFIFHVYDQTGKCLRSFGKPDYPKEAEKSNSVDKYNYPPPSFYLENDRLYRTSHFSNTILVENFSSDQLLFTQFNYFTRWREVYVHYLSDGVAAGLENGTGHELLGTDSAGRLFNFLTTCMENTRCQYHLQVYSNQGKTIAEANDIQFWAMSKDKQDRFYGSYYGNWTLVRCRIELESFAIPVLKK